MNWRDTQQKRCRSGHRSKIDSATGFLFPKATWRVQEAALVTLEQATTAKASMMLSPDLQVLSMCQDRASHLPSSTGGRLPLKNGTKARNTTCRHTHPFFERWSHYATHTDLSLNPCLTTRLVLQVFATTSGL